MGNISPQLESGNFSSDFFFSLLAIVPCLLVGTYLEDSYYITSPHLTSFLPRILLFPLSLNPPPHPHLVSPLLVHPLYLPRVPTPLLHSSKQKNNEPHRKISSIHQSTPIPITSPGISAENGPWRGLGSIMIHDTLSGRKKARSMADGGENGTLYVGTWIDVLFGVEADRFAGIRWMGWHGMEITPRFYAGSERASSGWRAGR